MAISLKEYLQLQEVKWHFLPWKFSCGRGEVWHLICMILVNFFSKNLTWLDSFQYNINRKSFGSAFNHHGWFDGLKSCASHREGNPFGQFKGIYWRKQGFWQKRLSEETSRTRATKKKRRTIEPEERFRCTRPYPIQCNQSYHWQKECNYCV